MFGNLIHSVQPGLALLVLVLAILCVRHMRHPGQAGIGWLGVSTFFYLVNHVLPFFVYQMRAFGFVGLVLTASIALSAMLVGLRLFADGPADGPLSRPRWLFAAATPIFAVLILAAAGVAPIWVHLVPGLMLA